MALELGATTGADFTDADGGRMKAHIVGGGFAGLAAAALLIRNANMPGPDITIYEADDKLGGGFFLDGDAERLQPARLDLRQGVPLRFGSARGRSPPKAYSNINVAEQFLTFNKEHPFDDQTHIVDREPPPRA